MAQNSNILKRCSQPNKVVKKYLRKKAFYFIGEFLQLNFQKTKICMVFVFFFYSMFYKICSTFTQIHCYIKFHRRIGVILCKQELGKLQENKIIICLFRMKMLSCSFRVPQE